MPNDRARSSALVASLLALLSPRAPSSFVAALARGQQSLDPLRAFDTPLFPYPVSLEVLDVVCGALPVPADPGHGGYLVPPPEPPIAFPAGGKLLERALVAGDTAAALVDSLVQTCREALRHANDAGARARLDRIYRGILARLVKLVQTAEFEGLPLIDGARDVYLVLPPSATRTLFVDLPDWRPGTLGLQSSIADSVAILSILSALDCAESAADSIDVDRTRLAIARQAYLEGDPAGGLAEIERLLGRMRVLAEQATDGRLNTSDRVLLDMRRASDLARLDLVAFTTRFEGVPLLSGGRVSLQGALGTTLLFDLPYVDSSVLGLSGPYLGITTLTSAETVFESLGDALLEVRGERERVHETRDELANGVLRLR